MKYSEIKQLKEFCNGLFSEPCYREVIEKVQDRGEDFTVENGSLEVRFIAADEIDRIQAQELESDLYVLGCFNAWFIADQCNWPVELVEAAQQGEAFEALGQAIVNTCCMVEFAQAYSSADGYGHHFNHYDGDYVEINMDGVNYYVFDLH